MFAPPRFLSRVIHPGHALLLALGLGLALPAFAQPAPEPDGPPPRFGLPVQCKPGTDCWIQNYFDHDASTGATDYTCGSLTYDRHFGTDFRISTMIDVEKGVAVVASAPGEVRGTRDDMDDVSVREIGPNAIRGKECGNGVLVNHGGGWISQYCHLKKGSVTVKTGDKVQAGDKLGLIGLSGNTEFPHVHFEVRFRSTPVDPFVGRVEPTQCNGRRAQLFSPAVAEQLSYVASGLLSSGFSAEQPNSAGVMAGRFQQQTIAPDAPLLLFWVEFFGLRNGDREVVRITQPNGEPFLEESKAYGGEPLARRLSFFGKRRPGTATWPGGTYRGDYKLERQVDGAWRTVFTVQRMVEVPGPPQRPAVAAATQSPPGSSPPAVPQPPVQATPAPSPTPPPASVAALPPPAPAATAPSSADAAEPGGRLRTLLQNQTPAASDTAVPAATDAIERIRSLLRGSETTTTGRRRKGPDAWMLAAALFVTLGLMAVAFLATYRR